MTLRKDLEDAGWLRTLTGTNLYAMSQELTQLVRHFRNEIVSEITRDNAIRKLVSFRELTLPRLVAEEALSRVGWLGANLSKAAAISNRIMVSHPKFDGEFDLLDRQPKEFSVEARGRSVQYFLDPGRTASFLHYHANTCFSANDLPVGNYEHEGGWSYEMGEDGQLQLGSQGIDLEFNWIAEESCSKRVLNQLVRALMRFLQKHLDWQDLYCVQESTGIPTFDSPAERSKKERFHSATDVSSHSWLSDQPGYNIRKKNPGADWKDSVVLASTRRAAVLLAKFGITCEEQVTSPDFGLFKISLSRLVWEFLQRHTLNSEQWPSTVRNSSFLDLN